MNNVLQIGVLVKRPLKLKKTDIEHCNELTDMERAVSGSLTWGTERKDVLTVSIEVSF